MFKRLYRYILLVTFTFTISCSYSGVEDYGDTFRLLAASKDSYFVVLGGDVSVELPSGLLYGKGIFGNKIIIGYYVSGIENSYTRAIYALGFNEASLTYSNYFGVELILDENDNQQAVGMELYYNGGEYYLDPLDIKFTEENKATILKGFNSQDIDQLSDDKYIHSTGLSITSTESARYSVATIKSIDNKSFIKGYTLVGSRKISEEIEMSNSLSSNLKTTGYHSIAPFGDNATLTYIKDDKKVEVYEMNSDMIKGRTLTKDNGLGSNAIYSTIATNKDRDIFVAYVDQDANLSMYKKDNGSLDVVTSFNDYFNGVKIGNVSEPIIKIYDNDTVITSYIDNSSKLLKIVVNNFIDSSSADYITIKPPTDLEIISFSVDIIDGSLYYIYSTAIGSEISVYESGLWRVIKSYSVYNNIDFVSIAGVSKKELYFMFHYENEYTTCAGWSEDDNCIIVGDNITDYVALNGFQSYEGTIKSNPNIGSFTIFNGYAYYLYNSSAGLNIAQSWNHYFEPKTPSTEDGLPMVKSNLDIGIFQLVNSNININKDIDLFIDSRNIYMDGSVR